MVRVPSLCLSLGLSLGLSYALPLQLSLGMMLRLGVGLLTLHVGLESSGGFRRLTLCQSILVLHLLLILPLERAVRIVTGGHDRGALILYEHCLSLLVRDGIEVEVLLR
jgi:hypothetical protein